MPNVATRDFATSDFATPIVAAWDIAMPDFATPDVAARDFSTSDVLMPDVPAPVFDAMLVVYAFVVRRRVIRTLAASALNGNQIPRDHRLNGRW
ncbi:hypothetical protein PYCCODRAFT_1430713 [Trametes coccinea BRFM310]|uniref:Uncharacterized protein n=1 Tax=Trametes coccinea (strain BRFM310) TaxID=1353009 RepID=A0A1Y2J255_TRAC3|nr:hypothetical protein PYCCODRAFT_1430713 [Trametes coccinea BRFM310]